MAERELLVRILGDDRDLQRALSNTDRRLTAIDNRTQTFGRNIGRAFAAAGLAIGTAEVFRLADQAVDAAVAVNEEVAKSEQIFGDSAQAIEDWSRTTADSIGISQRSALEATGVFGNLLRVTGILPEQAADMSRELVKLAADLASFNNADPTDVLNALRSGLVGEVEPLRRFGVLLSEVRVQQIALAQSGKDNVKELTNQEKALARYTIILRDAAPAVGDVDRTYDSLANSSRRLEANLDDLSANIGGVLIPVLEDATEMALLLFDALDKFRGVDFSPGFDFPEPPSWLRGLALAPVSPAGALALTVKRGLEELNKAEEEIEQAAGPGAGIGRDIARRQEEAAREVEKAALDANRAQRRQRRAFDAFVKGIGLKLDRASLTASLDDDIAALRELERAILRQIQREGRTFELVQRLTDARLQINSLVQQRADDAQQAGVDAFDATIDALNLNLERAEASSGLQDDLAALRAIEQAIRDRIAEEGETTDLLRQLFQIRERQEDVAKQVREQARERRQGRQFEALGLTAEGDPRVAGIGAIRKRGRGLIEELEASGLDAKKVAAFVERISVVFTDQFDNAGRNVRQAILDLFATISGALDEGSKGPLTKTSGLNTKKILAGLGLSEEEINALRGRLSSINSAGLQIATGQATAAASPARGFGGAQGAILVESHTIINLDGQQVAKVVTKQQQRSRRRNPQQKRGPNRNR